MIYGLSGTALPLFLVCCLACSEAAAASLQSAAAQGELSPRERTIVIGRVSIDPKKAYPRLEGMANYLARRLGPVGVTAGGVVIAKDNRQMIAYLRRGEVDLMSETALSAILFAEETGAEILLREWKKGVPVYRSILFARKDTGINTLADLEGRTIAFEDHGSTSAYLLPLALLKGEGLEPVELSSPEDEPPPGAVGYAFAYSELNIATWVATGLADAGALSSLDWEEPGQVPEPLKRRLAIFHTSQPFIRSLILARRGLRPEIKAQIKNILLNMHNDPKGADVLKAYFKVKKYDQIEGEVKASLDEVRRVFTLIRQELE